MIWFLIYIALAVPASVIAYVRLKRYNVTHFPNSYGRRRFPHASDLSVLVFVTAVWPVGLPVVFFTTRTDWEA